MSTVKNEADYSGALGGKVSLKRVGTGLVAKSRPKRKMPDASKKQILVQRKFSAASDWAKWKLQNDDPDNLYAARVTPKLRSAHMVAMSDYLNPPEVQSIKAIDYQGFVGDLITVHAFDDFMVSRVKVVITDTAGIIIEQGDAARSIGHNQLWEYTATVSNPSRAGTKILAIAFDNPNNEGSLEIVL